MLVWKKRDIKKTVSVLQYYVLLKIMMHKVRAFLTGRSTIISGFDLACFSSLFSEHLCVFDFHGSTCIVNFFDYLFLFTL